MRIDPAARKYITWPVGGAPMDTLLEWSPDDGITWHGLERTSPSTVRMSVAGPQASLVGAPVGTVVLPLGRTTPLFRVTDTPEIDLSNATEAIDVKR